MLGCVKRSIKLLSTLAIKKTSMRKYKLIQSYPSVPRSMKVGMEVIFNEAMGLYSHDATLDTFNKDEVENNPKFWEFLEERYFEVLSFTYGLDKRIYTKTGETVRDFPFKDVVNSFRSGKNDGILTDARLEECNNLTWEGDRQIHSIKRLSDGMVITVGDKISIGYNKFHIVEKFIVDEYFNGGISLSTSKGRLLASITSIDSVVKALFTTNDGVKIFTGDSYSFFWTNNDRARGQEKFKVYDVKSARLGSDATISENARFYSTNLRAGKGLIEEFRLFKTENGKDIFEGDTYWCVNTVPNLLSVFEQAAKERTKLNKTVLAFDTEDLAREFVVESAEVLSLKEIRNIVKNSATKDISDSLVELVKRKLNKG